MNLTLVFLAVGFSVTGQLFLKLGATTPVHGPADLVSNLLRPLTLLALAMYGMSALMWISVVSRVHLSYAYPLLGLNYALVVAISAWLLHEPVSLHRWVGVLLIMAGFVVVATS